MTVAANLSLVILIRDLHLIWVLISSEGSSGFAHVGP